MSSSLLFSGSDELAHPFLFDHNYPYTHADDMFAYAIKKPLEYPPNTVGRYRNCDPLALGYIIRRTVEARGEDYLSFPQRSMLPTPESMAQLQMLHAKGRVTSVRLHETKSVGLPFRLWAYDAMLVWLSDNQIPLRIALPDGDADEIVSTLQVYPDLVTVLVGGYYQHALWIRPMLNALPNAYLELSRYELPGKIDRLASEFGAERLLYGSWYPRYAMGPVLYGLHQTDLSEADLALVCAGNLERILGCGCGENQMDRLSSGKLASGFHAELKIEANR
ncbi:MAG: hypothetical protein AAF702_14550 [Chloroflexota bacterium]